MGTWYWQFSPKKGEQHWQNSDVDCGVAACCHQGLMAHCSLCRLLINGSGVGQKIWTKRVKRETETVGNRQRFARTVIALSICPHQQSCQVLKSHSWKIIVKRGNYYFCPAADNLFAWQIMRPKSQSVSIGLVVINKSTDWEFLKASRRLRRRRNPDHPDFHPVGLRSTAPKSNTGGAYEVTDTLL